MMGAALIPLAGMIGGGIDVARMYITKTRLQHACDAGALAGRKAMGGGQWSQENGKPNSMARTFFAANYRDGSFGSTELDYEFSESAGKVKGDATALLPMTLTQVIGFKESTIAVTCEAEMRLPNTDVMFVLDNTGSMNEYAKTGDPQRKMEALKSSVKCFYEILARLDTTELCAGDPPSGGTSDEVQIRFGFVPYDMNVNVGRILPSNWFVDRWIYQSRVQTTVSGVVTGYADPPVLPDYVSTDKVSTTSQSQCEKTNNVPGTVQSIGSLGNAKNEGIDPSSGAKTTNAIQTGNGIWQADQTVTETQREYVSWTAGKDGCKYRVRTRSYIRAWYYRQVVDGTPDSVVFKAWIYKPVQVDLTQLKDGNGWKADYKYTLPIASNFGNLTKVWDGCIEERDTVRQASYSPIPPEAYDLDINSIPTSNDATKWRPALTDAVFPRKQNYDNSLASPDSWTKDEIKTFTSFSGKGYSCVIQAQPLRTYPGASEFEGYVDQMSPKGNTYHDIGMIWGARLISPTGMWRETNEFTPRGGQIQRHMIFMTDGDACTESHNYAAYGLAWYERRQTDPSAVPTDGCSANTVPGTLTDQVTARTAALCTAVKNMKDTTLWVIWFGVNKVKIENQLRACASPDRFFAARDSASLQTTFRQIANQISQLRVTN